MQTVILQMLPSSTNKALGLNPTSKMTSIPAPLGRAGQHIIKNIGDKIIKPILWADMNKMDEVYLKKITPFQEYCTALIHLIQKQYKLKQRLEMDLTLYDETISMINKNPIFTKNIESITETVEILKDYEIIIYDIISNRLPELEKALTDIDVKDLLNSLYGSYIAIICFWYIARDSNQNRKTIPAIAEISRKLALNLASYTDTLDMMTNPEEMEMMKRAKEWERQHLQNRPQ